MLSGVRADLVRPFGFNNAKPVVLKLVTHLIIVLRDRTSPCWPNWKNAQNYCWDVMPESLLLKYNSMINAYCPHLPQSCRHHHRLSAITAKFSSPYTTIKHHHRLPRLQNLRNRGNSGNFPIIYLRRCVGYRYLNWLLTIDSWFRYHCPSICGIENLHIPIQNILVVY